MPRRSCRAEGAAGWTLCTCRMVDFAEGTLMDDSDHRPEDSSSPASAPRRVRQVIQLDDRQKQAAIAEMARRFGLLKQQLDACGKKRK